MTKCKKIETIYSSDMENAINKFVADKKVISVSVVETERRWIAFIVYEEEIRQKIEKQICLMN